ncbi:MAG: hypothetical protein RQ741_01260 [Wenzhouxiangellaceae bacterium]|nr:hypothetical protein [Wenzhouxiangellaceae bacterium]
MHSHSAPADRNRVGVVVALDWETAGFIGGQARSPFRLEVTGPGPQAASRGAGRLVEQGVSTLLSWGTAGALVTGLSPGDVVLASSVQADGRVFVVDACRRRLLARGLEGRHRLLDGSIVSVKHPVTTARLKSALARSGGAIAVDMESASIAAIADAAGLPFIAVRVIVDTLQHPIPGAAIAALDGADIRVMRLLAGLLKAPNQIPALIGLARAGAAARAVLKDCARRLPAIIDKF